MSYDTISRQPSTPRSHHVKWRRPFRYLYLRLRRQRGSSKAIARGLAAGVFAGWFPLFGLQTIIGVALAIPLRGNKLMAAVGTWVSNPLTYIPIYFFNFRVGQYLLSQLSVKSDVSDLNDLVMVLTHSNWQAFRELLAFGGVVSGTLFLGCFTIGLISASISYISAIYVISMVRDRPDLQQRSRLQKLQKQGQQ